MFGCLDLKQFRHLQVLSTPVIINNLNFTILAFEPNFTKVDAVTSASDLGAVTWTNLDRISIVRSDVRNASIPVALVAKRNVCVK